LKVTAEPQVNCELAVTIEVEEDAVQEQMQKAARKLARRGRIPGYRKGKAPYHVVLRHYGEEAVFEEMLEDYLQVAYREALDEADIEPYAPGRLVDIQRNPLTLKLEVPLPPEVDLGDYRQIRKKLPRVTVGAKKVDEALENIRKEHATWEPVERPIQEEDMASVTFAGDVGAQRVFEETEDFPLLIGRAYGEPLPGFTAKLVGASAGEELDFTLPFPADDPREEFAGKECSFHVRIETVRALDLPPLDDDLAKMLGDYDDLKGLRAGVRQMIREEEKRQAHDELAGEVLNLVVEQSSVLYPPIMLEEELDSMVEDMERRLKREGQDLDTYVSLAGQTVEEFRESLRPRAEQNLQRSLVLTHFIQEEKIVVSPEEWEQELERVGERYLQAGVPAELLDSDAFRGRVYMDVRVGKAKDRLVEIATGEAPPLSEEDAAEDPPSESVPGESGEEESESGE
jgi:trigger factor